MKEKFITRNLYILYLRLKEKWTYQKIADSFGISKDRVRQIVGVLICKLCRYINNGKFKEIITKEDEFKILKVVYDWFDFISSVSSNFRKIEKEGEVIFKYVQ